MKTSTINIFNKTFSTLTKLFAPQNYIKRTLYTLASLLILAPTIASAHVKWFAEPMEYVRPYSLTDTPVIISIVLALALIVFGFYLEKKLNVPKWFSNFVEKYAPNIISIASIGFGLSFLIFSINGFIFAPNLVAVGDIGVLMLAIQATAGLMILFGIYERLGGLLLIVLFGLAVKEYGATEMMDTLEMVGFAFYAMIMGRPKWRLVESKAVSHLVHKTHQYGISILRIGTGLNLMVLGLSEKILAPSLTQNFLEHYNWNFMHTLGFEWFTNYWFAYSAGVAEFMFGLFFLLGLITRVSILALAVFLLTTLMLLGPVELMGHLPHFSIACVLLFFGAGSRLHMKK